LPFYHDKFFPISLLFFYNLIIISLCSQGISQRSVKPYFQEQRCSHTMTKKNQSILIIDDDDFVLKSLTRVLRGGNYSIRCYLDSEEMLLPCSLREFDLVLSNQRMPGIQGAEFFSQLMQVHPHIRRFLISGYMDFSNVADAFNQGLIHKFVVKPRDNDILRMLIEDELRLKAQLGGSTPPSISPKQIKLEVDFEADETLTDFHGTLTCDEAVLQQISIIQ
jgi:response regulator RpfG family c-di-GMP phosphodiesterase